MRRSSFILHLICLVYSRSTLYITVLFLVLIILLGMLWRALTCWCPPPPSYTFSYVFYINSIYLVSGFCLVCLKSSFAIYLPYTWYTLSQKEILVMLFSRELPCLAWFLLPCLFYLVYFTLSILSCLIYLVFSTLSVLPCVMSTNVGHRASFCVLGCRRIGSMASLVMGIQILRGG